MCGGGGEGGEGREGREGEEGYHLEWSTVDIQIKRAGSSSSHFSTLWRLEYGSKPTKPTCL